MGTIVSRAELENMFDETLQEVTRRVGGIHLRQGDAPLEGELYTVYVKFDRGVQSSLCLCAEKSMFLRLTRFMMRREEVTHQDMEDFSKENFNVVCGHIAAKLFEATQKAYRFSVPGFCSGRYQPEEHKEYFALSYAGDQNEGARLVHLVPVETPGGDWAGLRTDQTGELVLD